MLNLLKKQEEVYAIDWLVFKMLLLHLPFAFFIAPWQYGTYTLAVYSTLANMALFCGGYYFFRGSRLFGLIAAISLMYFSAIFIQAQMGRIEMHFHVFVAMPILLFYRDWLTILLAALTIAVHHLLLTLAQMNGLVVLGEEILLFEHSCTWVTMILHAFFVVVEAGILVIFAEKMRKERMIETAIAHAVKAIANEHNLNQQVPSHAAGDTADNFNHMVDSLAELIEMLTAAGTRLVESSDRMQTVGEGTRVLINMQKMRSDEIADSTDQLVQSIHDVANHAASAANTAQAINEDVLSGNASVQESVQSVSELNHSMGTVSASINDLADKTQEIGGVLDVIRNVSEQTNLLALNAAIEAARAGEQGRGFAVVADEVRLLAQRTHDSTEEINQMIIALQASANTAVNSMAEGKERSDRNVTLIETAGSVLSKISESIAMMNDLNNQVATAAEQQSSVASEINKNVHDMKIAMDEMSKGGEVVVDTAKSLSSIAQQVDARVQPYKC